MNVSLKEIKDILTTTIMANELFIGIDKTKQFIKTFVVEYNFGTEETNYKIYCNKKIRYVCSNLKDAINLYNDE
jgi:hypothetical protein